MDNKIDSHQLFLFLYYMIILQKSPKHDSAQKARDLPAGRQVQGAKFSRNEAYCTPQIGFFQQNHYIIKHESVLYFMGRRKHMTMSLIKSLFTKELCMIINKYSVNPLSRRGSAIRPAIETLQKANRSCGRARMATVHWKGIFL